MPLALVPVDNIAGQQVCPYWNGYAGSTQQFPGGRYLPGGGAQRGIYNTPALNFAGGVNFPGSAFGGAYSYNGVLYAVTADTLFTSAPTSNGPSIWKSLDSGATWSLVSSPPLSTAGNWGSVWMMTWNPSVSANIITFLVSSSQLIDFNLQTLAWSAVYATNYNVSTLGGNQAIVRLSDGRVRAIGAFNTGTTPDGHLMYATANTSGSGMWDSMGNFIVNAPYPYNQLVPWNWDMGGICVDASDRVHAWYRYSQSTNQASAGTGVPYAPVSMYVNVDTANTVTSQTSAPFDHSKATGAMLALDNIYVGAIGLSAANSIDVYVGVGLANPVWHGEQVAVGAFPPDHLFLKVVNGLVTLAWEEQDPAHNVPMKIKLSQRSGGAWSVPQTILDLASVQPVSPFQPTANVWIGEGFSFSPVPASRGTAGGIELLVALDISTDANGTSGTMTFAIGESLIGGNVANLFQFPAYVLPQPCAYPIHPENKNLLTLKVPEYAFRKLRL